MKISIMYKLALAVLMAGCHSATAPVPAASDLTLRVGSFNIRTSGGDRGTPNAWVHRRKALVDLVKKMDLDAFGLQEVSPDQEQFLREKLPEYEFVGVYRNADKKSGEASPVFYRKSRFAAEKSGTFWLSETPDVAGSKSWGTAFPRICSYMILRDKESGRRFCFANTHTDHISELARKNGMMLIIERMKEFGGGAPIVFTGDHNCTRSEPPAVAMRKVLRDARDISETPDFGPQDSFQGYGLLKNGPKSSTSDKDDHRIDYIYVSEGTRVLNFTTHGDRRPGTDLYVSDHYPVSATIVLPPEAK